jgi:hypothetical protein
MSKSGNGGKRRWGEAETGRGGDGERRRRGNAETGRGGDGERRRRGGRGSERKGEAVTGKLKKFPPTSIVYLHGIFRFRMDHLRGL